MPTTQNLPESYQAQFHRCWGHLVDPHVRALAWLLDSPDLLDAHAARWKGKIASLSANDATATHDWLSELDRNPAPLHTVIDEKPTHRLGYYAEKLMMFYFLQMGVLVGHGVQVQSSRNGTIGEFDFLLRDEGRLVHWEFATKFYLLANDGMDANASDFVGPNLADTLHAKMRKIFEQQLLLAQHADAQVHLPQAVESAQALVKGWLFYPRAGRERGTMPIDGISPKHCRGFWCAASEWQLEDGLYATILPRLQWLAPAKLPIAEASTMQELHKVIQAHFQRDNAPLLVAVLDRQGSDVIEIDRGFVVPDDWLEKAHEYLKR
jgi:hypothetical protein